MCFAYMVSHIKFSVNEKAYMFYRQFCLMNTNETRPLSHKFYHRRWSENAQGHNLSCGRSNNLDSYLSEYFMRLNPCVCVRGGENLEK